MDLIAEARRVRNNAYAPFSKFLVGAALRCADGAVFVGCNVENSSYGLSCCAERNAVFAAVAAGKRSIEEIAIVIEGPRKSMCGACLQVLAEFNLEMRVIVADVDGTVHSRHELSELLPHAFRLCSEVR